MASQTPPTTRGDKQECFKIVEPDVPSDLDFLGLSVYCDEIQQGPVYNYARMFTWRLTAHRLLTYFDTAADNVNKGRTIEQARTYQAEQKQVQQNGAIPLGQVQVPPQHAPAANPAPQKTQTLEEVFANASVADREMYCGIPTTGELPVFPAGSDKGVFPNLWFHILSAFAMAVCVQWGTTGAAIVIAYLTDAKGLGCRSGSYLLYGCLSTFAFALFFLSAVLSRAAVLRAETPKGRRGFAFGLLRAAAVTARLAGRAVAACNAMWIVLSSIWELIGFFDNCWCESTQLSWGDRAWVAMFKNTIELKDYATGPWAGGVFMSSFVMAVSYGVFWLFCYDQREV